MTRALVRRSVILAVFLGVANACGAGGGPVGERLAVMELDPAQGLTFTYGAVDVGDSTSALVSIIDSGDANLVVSSITLDYQPANPALETGPDTYAFQLRFNDGERPPRTVAFQGGGTATTAEIYYFKVSVTNLGDDLPRAAEVVIASTDADTPVVRLPVTAVSGAPRLRVTPEVLDFGRVGQGDTGTRTVVLRNTGVADLVVDRFLFAGSEQFSFRHGDQALFPDAVTAGGVAFDSPVVLAADEARELRFEFAPLSEHPADATFVLYSNAPDAREGTVILLRGNQALPCLQVQPEQVDFGATLPGSRRQLPVQLCSCGTTPLTITGLALVDDLSGGAFSLGPEPFQAPGPGAPLVLAGGACTTLDVLYAPTAISPTGADGAPIPDTARLQVTNDSFQADARVPVRGVAAEVLCPTAVIEVDEGDQVIPQTLLHLRGDPSFSPNGPITSFQWTVEQPGGSVGVFVPTGGFPNPLFEANVAGTYVFTLEVADEAGVAGCAPARREVRVVPNEAVHVELLWDTPGDPDPTDDGPGAGTDLDLHFAHPFAASPDKDGDGLPDPWFSDPYDVYWFNAAPEWGSYDPSVDDNPGLDRDDTDGAGPENVNLNQPEGDDAHSYVYRVGVHYWADHGFGVSYATVRVYVEAALVFEARDVRMEPGDLWDVGYLSWPDGRMTSTEPPDDPPKITPDY